MNIKIIEYTNDYIIPTRAHQDDVGLDIKLPKDGVLAPGANKIPLGYGFEVPKGVLVTFLVRSGYATSLKNLEIKTGYKDTDRAKAKDLMAHKECLFIQPPPVDCNYTGEVHCLVYNPTDKPLYYKRGDSFMQMIVVPAYQANLVLTEGTARGNNGFGSSGD